MFGIFHSTYTYYIYSFEFFVYDVPSQPEICSIQTEEIIKAYNESRVSGTRGGHDDWLAQYYALRTQEIPLREW